MVDWFCLSSGGGSVKYFDCDLWARPWKLNLSHISYSDDEYGYGKFERGTLFMLTFIRENKNRTKWFPSLPTCSLDSTNSGIAGHYIRTDRCIHSATYWSILRSEMFQRYISMAIKRGMFTFSKRRSIFKRSTLLILLWKECTIMLNEKDLVITKVSSWLQILLPNDMTIY